MNGEIVGYVIALLGYAPTGEAIEQPCYIREGDVDFVGPNPEADGGIITKTAEISEAKRFANWDEAVTYWQSRSTVKPTRRDGKPNRPFTAYHVEFIQVRAFAKESS